MKGRHTQKGFRNGFLCFLGVSVGSGSLHFKKEKY